MRKSIIITFTLILLLRIIFVFTYPPDAHGNDGPSYAISAASGRPNIIFAPGVSWIFGFPLRAFGDMDEYLASVEPTDGRNLRHLFASLSSFGNYEHIFSFIYSYCLITLLFDSMLLILSYFIIRKIAGHITALISTIIIGLSPYHIASVFSFSPEGIQGISILLFVIIALLYRMNNKLNYLILSYVILAVTYLFKYNSLYFILIFIFIIASSKLSFLKSAMHHLISLSIGVVIIVLFLIFVYAPQTGTVSNMDHSWILLHDLKKWIPDQKWQLDAGDETKRLYVLNSVLPKNFAIAAYQHLDFIGIDMREIRTEYRKKYNYIINADHEKLAKLVKQYPPPSSSYMFTLGYLPTFACIGPEYSNAIGTRVWLEHVLRFPTLYLFAISKDSFLNLFDSQNVGKGGSFYLIPHSGSPKSFPAEFGYDHIITKPDNAFNRFIPDKIYVWRPGEIIFTLLIWIYDESSPFWYFILIVTSIVSIFDRNRGNIGRLLLIVTCLSIGFVIFSNAFYYFRLKEAISAFPVLAFGLALSMTYIYRKSNRSQSLYL